MNPERLQLLLAEVAAGTVTPETALVRLAELPFADLEFAKLDLHRELRTGHPEVVYGAGKRRADLVPICRRSSAAHRPFLVPPPAAALRLPLAAVSRRFEVIAVSVTDSTDEELPAVGLVRVVDPETGARHLVDAGAARVRESYRKHAALRRGQLSQAFADAGVEHLVVDSGVAPVEALGRFFHSRQRRLSR